MGDYIDEKDAKDITIGELLNHTSGLDSFSSKRPFEKGIFHYYNYGYALLGKIIEKKLVEVIKILLKKKFLSH